MKIALVDGDFLMYYATYPNKVIVEVSNTDGDIITEERKIPKTEDEVYVEVNKRLREIFEATNATHYIGYLSMPSFRKAVNPDYKSNRKDYVKPQWFDECKAYLRSKWKFTAWNELEADDCVCISQSLILSTLSEAEYIRVSNDKDVIKLAGECYNPIKKEFTFTTNSEANDYFWKSMIIGDTADAVKGIPGKGKVYANDIFEHDLGVPIESIIFNEYVQHFGEYKGIEQFYKNYKSLKILNEYPGFELPEITKIE